MELRKIFRGAVAETIGVIGLGSLVIAGMGLIKPLALWASLQPPVLFGIMALGVACMITAVAIKTYGAHRDKQHEVAEKQQAVQKDITLAPARGLEQAQAVQKIAEVPDISFAEKYRQEQTTPAVKQL